MDKDEIWSATLALLLEDIETNDPKSVFLNLLTPVGSYGDQFVLIADNEPVESWVRKNYLQEIREKVHQVSGKPYTISIVTDSPEPEEVPVNTGSNQANQTTPLQSTSYSPSPDWDTIVIDPNEIQPQKETSDRSQETQTGPEDVGLFTKCSFDNFVVGASNEFARGAALAVAESPGTSYNPLFIYGNPGLGKTHLLVAIANYILQNFPWMTTRYVNAETFTKDYVEATQRNQWGDFNKKYHQVDNLLIDDVQRLEGREETINQLFNIFNEMTNQNKQIVLSADRAPKDIAMDDRMKSRFVSGLLADVKAPELETRMAIAKNYLSRLNNQMNFYGNVPEEVLLFIAESAKSNIRPIEGALRSLVGHMSIFKKNNISLEEAQDLLCNFFPTAADRQINIALIQSEVEKFFDISHEDMISAKRSKGITTPRHIAIYLSRYMTEESLESIGKKFGGRDHTTIMHSVNKIEREQKDNRTLIDQLEKLRLNITERS